MATAARLGTPNLEAYRRHHVSLLKKAGRAIPRALRKPIRPPQPQDKDMASSSSGTTSDRSSMDAEGESDDDEDPNRLWCYCRKVADGLMIGCDNPCCQYGWFHASCLNLRIIPPGTWYCPACRVGTTET